MKVCECGCIHCDNKIAALEATNLRLKTELKLSSEYSTKLSRMIFAINREIDPPHPELHHHYALSMNTRKRMHGYRQALLKISKGVGRFSRDPYEHACNTIEDMKHLALNALGHVQEEEI